MVVKYTVCVRELLGVSSFIIVNFHSIELFNSILFRSHVLLLKEKYKERYYKFNINRDFSTKKFL